MSFLPVMASATLPTLNTLNTLNIRLDRSNYTFWRAQILATTTAHGFEEYLLGTIAVPPQRSTNGDSGTSSINPEYSNWLRIDKFLYSWILNSISENMLGYVSRCSTSCEVWSTLENIFRTQSQARVLHLKSMLQSMKKDDLSITEYILKTIVDEIHAAGKVVIDDDFMLYVLHGLGQNMNQ
ncbi:hypothetical protein DH2020_007505 [Rehmannia glutinosa]|uniref:Retrotransposon Copia-like N-terminal domain-containing protein n=1 Tax=Rehmannia glutinosa TaxID=99300 RepID=A0ABR0TYE2_REHGL